MCRLSFTESSGNALSDALMWSPVIVVSGVFLDHATQVIPMEDERVVQAFSFQAADPPLADRVRLRCSIGRPQLLDAAAGGDRCAEITVLLVAVMNEVLGSLTLGRGFPELRREPSVRRGTGDSDVHNAACL